MPIIFHLSQESNILLIVLFVLDATQFTYDLDEVPTQIFTTRMRFYHLFCICYICEVLHSKERIYTVLFI